MDISNSNLSDKNEQITKNNKNISDIINNFWKNKSLKNKLFFEFSAQEILNIMEALTLYKRLVLPEKYKPIIDNQISNISEMLKLQNVDLLFKDDVPQLDIGSIILVDISLNQEVHEVKGILLGASDIENLFKVAIIKNHEFNIIDVPLNVIKKLK